MVETLEPLQNAGDEVLSGSDGSSTLGSLPVRRWLHRRLLQFRAAQRGDIGDRAARTNHASEQSEMCDVRRGAQAGVDGR
jgi:hypothetical protein